MGRPAVSVVVPFHGTPAQAATLLAALSELRLGAADEVLVVDNSGAGAVPARDGVRVIAADAERSAYYARNAGAEGARGEWLLFLDADCRPRPDLIERYLAEPVPGAVGALVGEVEGEPGQPSLVSRYARSRGHLAQHHHFGQDHRPWGVTANLLVRRRAWASVGGFQEGIRSAGDTEFSWRLQDAGWELRYRPEAVVTHSHRETVGQLARQAARYGAGRAWVTRRYPGEMARPTLLRPLARCLAGIAAWTVTGRFERAAFKALDGVYVAARWGAYWLSNTPPGARDVPTTRTAAAAGAFPDSGDAGVVAAVRALGEGVHVEAASRPLRIDREAARRLAVRWAEDDGAARRLRDTALLAASRPAAVARTARTAGPGQLLALAPAARRLEASGATRVVDAGAGELATQALRRLAGLGDG